MSRRYRPSNGTEGMDFMAKWCSLCTRDDNGDCPILGASMALAYSDPKYPAELTYDAKGKPCCTAFEDAVTAAKKAEVNKQLGITPVADHPGQTKMFGA